MRHVRTPPAVAPWSASARRLRVRTRDALASGVALAALQVALAGAAATPAQAGCTITSDVAPVSSQCDASFVSLRTGTGATSLLITDMTTVGVDMAPSGMTTPTSHTLIIGGTTTISNPSYSAVY
ncbi:hypothetical protein CCR97_17025 [Rhodoplanes elegans]|uniref:Spore coat protein U domain-containing protein n=1 Tax=Rhodoplanes elegans TaxID=29408 RepID=A0A327KR81_9BRAD|nr:hypothetical protein [Rhodoplanes elegans]MBK5959893.1 hypothetical protein [Rhodoplanes elegans]RAI39865.1 hypothetical protein CH338_08030 [Rhodoplanes elegans]